MVNEYLSHLVDRNYSSKTVHAYGYDLLAYCRWLSTEDIAITAVTTDVLLAFLKAVRKTRGSPKSNLAHCTRSSRHPSQTPRRTTPPPQNPERIALNGKQLRAAHISQKSLRQRLMETIIGLFKTECVATTVFHNGPYKPSTTSSTQSSAGSTGTTTDASTAH